MGRRSFRAVCIWVSLSALAFCIPAGAATHLVIQTGQSNMANFYSEDGYTPALEQAYGTHNVLVVKHADASLPIYHWCRNYVDAEGTSYPDAGAYYDALVAAVNAETADHTISCSFAATSGTTHVITVTAGSNGTVSPNGPVIVNAGATIVFTLSPDAGYEVVDVVVDGSSVGAVTTYSFPNVQADHSISVTFDAVAPPADGDDVGSSISCVASTTRDACFGLPSVVVVVCAIAWLVLRKARGLAARD